MQANAVIIDAPERLTLAALPLDPPRAGDLVVAIDHSGVSTGTEKLLWQGRMPNFPGMGYPLVPGYEAVGTVVEAVGETRHRVGDKVFVPGATCFGAVKGLFGAAAAMLGRARRAHRGERRAGRRTRRAARAGGDRASCAGGWRDA